MKAKTDEARRHFQVNLDGRLEELSGVLTRLAAAPDSSILKEGLLRRVQAMHSAASLLGFSEAGEIFERCARVLQGCTSSVSRSAIDELRTQIRRVPDQVPMDDEEAARVELEPAVASPSAGSVESEPASSEARHSRATILGIQPTVADLLAMTTDPVLHERVVSACEAAPPERRRHAHLASTADQALHLARVRSPEVIAVDWSHPEARSFIATLHADPLSAPSSLVVLVEQGDQELPAMLADFAGTRVLKKPVSVGALARAFASLGDGAQAEVWDGLTIEALCDRLCAELKQGLAGAVPAELRSRKFDLGAGSDVKAALWTALAKVRLSVAQHAGGSVVFVDEDPTRGVPMLLEDPTDDDPGQTGQGGTASLAGRRILVIDDDPAIAWFLSGALRKAGAEVIEAHNGARGLELAYQNWPDLVFSDVLMPDLDGPSLCRELKSDLLLSDTPIILVSWKEDLLERVRELGSSADAYLRKEASAPSVVRRASELLGNRELLERRIAANPDVQGRLDGTTPRSVLDMVCRMRRNAGITFSDSSRVFVATVVNGELWSVQGRGPSGEALIGDVALRELLGLRLGGFEIAGVGTPGARQFNADLPLLLAPAAARARALSRLFAPERIAGVAQVAIGTSAAAGPLPRASEAALEGLASGSAPSALAEVHGAEAISRLLADLTRRGAISSVFSAAGDDLLAAEIERRNARQDALNAVPDFDTPRPGDRLEVDPSRSELPPRVAPAVRAIAVEAPLVAPPSSEVSHGASLFQVDWDADDRVDSPQSIASPPVPLLTANARVPVASAEAVELGDLLASQLAASPMPARVAPGAGKASAFASPPPAPNAEPAVPRRRLERHEVRRDAEPRVGATRAPSTVPSRPTLKSAMPQRSPAREVRWEGAEGQIPGASPRDLGEIFAWLRAGTGQAIRGAATSGRERVQALARGGKASWERAAVGTKSSARVVRGAASAVGVTIVAGGIAFGAVRVGSSLFSSGMADASKAEPAGDTAPVKPTDALPSTTAPIGPPTGSGAAAEPAAVAVPSAFAVSELEVPAGVELGAGKGLLEISTGGSHKLYVGGVFVGAGPVRRIPVPEGEHMISVRLDGDDRSQSVSVAAGRRTRVTVVSLEGAQSVANK